MIGRDFLFALGLIILISSPLSECNVPSAVAQEVKKLKDICANRYVPLTSVHEVRLMIRILIRRPEYCAAKFRQSFMELDSILGLEQDQRLCDKDKFDQIMNYHFRFINPKLESYEYGDDLRKLEKKNIRQKPLQTDLFDYGVQTDQYDSEILIPVSLQYFFKAWALQVSGLCKRTLMENLSRAQDNLDASDMKIVDDFIRASRVDIIDPITKKKVDDLKFNGIVYMPELEGTTRPELDALREQALKLDLTEDPELDRLFHACKLRFKPIYSKLILPIVRLAKLGYDYMGTKLKQGYGVISKDANVRAWSAIAAICEARGDYKMETQPPVDMTPVKYSPTINFILDDNLWIKGRDQLQKEFARIDGSRSKGIKQFAYLVGVQKNKLVSMLDPHQFAWFRKNRIALGITVGSMGFITSFTNLCLTLAKMF